MSGIEKAEKSWQMKRDLEGELNLSFTNKGKRYIVDSLEDEKRLDVFHLEPPKESSI